jgi:molybdate transport system substrate-binding protein
MRARCGALLLAVAVALGVTACGDEGGGSNAASTTTTTATSATGSITVSAAASLTEAFDEIGTRFTRANPDAEVAFNLGSSGTLATQIQQGAPADTFASADTANMDELVAADLVDGAPVVFARNRLVIVTKPGNPEKVRTLADLARLDVVSLCGAEVPCGKYAAEILQNAEVQIPEDHVTRGQDVKATLGAVTAGDADAAVVYVTDAKGAGDTVTTVAIPDAQNAIATYPIAVLQATGNRATAEAFVDFVLARAGQSVLRAHGFLPPE